jgi:GntR family carbon starvation induced transcriptional regulator
MSAAESTASTLAGRAEAVLREMIFSGELSPGERIHVDEMSGRLKMSPIPVREALRSMSSRGLVDAIPQRGFRVRPADRQDFLETYDLRILLDPHAARRAVPRMDDAALSEMERALDAWTETILRDDSEHYDHDHRAFHFAIYDRSGSRWLLETQSMLWENSLRYQRISSSVRGTPEQRVAEHRQIADACRAGDADEAARLVRAHLQRTCDTVAQVLGVSAVDPDAGQPPQTP